MLEGLILIGLVVNLVCLVVLWPRRQLLSSKLFMAVLVFQWLWEIGFFLEIRAQDVEWALFWDDVQFLPYLLVSPAWLYLARTLADRPLFKGSGHPLTTLSIPLFVVIVLGYDQRFEWLRDYDSIDFTNNILSYGFGNLLYITALWTYALMFISISLLIGLLRQLKATHRLQVAFVLIGMLIPTIVAIPNILGYSYFGLNDVTPFTFAVGNLAILYGLVRYNAFEFQLISQLPILNQLPVGVIILDHRKRIIEWNPLAEKMLNTEINAPGIPIETLPIGEHLVLEKNTLWHADEHHFELQFHMLETQETVDSYMITLRDITERVNQQFELQTSNQTLQTLLDELTNAQEQLLSTEKQKSMTSLIKSIAHEFNTPLGNLVTLLDGFLHSEEKDEYMPLIQKNVDRVINLIERLKRVANIDTNETPESFRLRDAIDDVIRAKSFEMGKSNIHFDIRVEDELRVVLPRIALESALIQLIENAMKHAFDDSFSNPTVWVQARKQNKVLSITVKDNGKGLPEHVRSNLFVPFSNQSQQLSISTGVGLFSVYQWVTQVLHGHIELCRDAKVATEFCIEIPLQHKEH